MEEGNTVGTFNNDTTHYLLVRMAAPRNGQPSRCVVLTACALLPRLHLARKGGAGRPSIACLGSLLLAQLLPFCRRSLFSFAPRRPSLCPGAMAEAGPAACTACRQTAGEHQGLCARAWLCTGWAQCCRGARRPCWRLFWLRWRSWRSFSSWAPRPQLRGKRPSVCTGDLRRMSRGHSCSRGRSRDRRDSGPASEGDWQAAFLDDPVYHDARASRRSGEHRKRGRAPRRGPNQRCQDQCVQGPWLRGLSRGRPSRPGFLRNPSQGKGARVCSVAQLSTFILLSESATFCHSLRTQDLALQRSQSGPQAGARRPGRGPDAGGHAACPSATAAYDVVMMRAMGAAPPSTPFGTTMQRARAQVFLQGGQLLEQAGRALPARRSALRAVSCRSNG